jgi:hypothetical protein
VGIAHGRADVLVAEELLDFPQVLSNVVKRIVVAEWRSPWAVIPHPKRSVSGPEPQIERAIGEWRSCVSSKHKLRSREGDPSRGEDSSTFEALLDRFPLKERRAQTGRGTSWKTLPLPLICRATISFPTAWQPAQLSWTSSSNLHAFWKSALASWNVRAEP